MAFKKVRMNVIGIGVLGGTFNTVLIGFPNRKWSAAVAVHDWYWSHLHNWLLSPENEAEFNCQIILYVPISFNYFMLLLAI